MTTKKTFTAAEIESETKRVVSEMLGVPLDKITNESKFVSEMGADSLDVVECIMSIEDTFHIEITDEDAGKIETIQQAIDAVKNYLKVE